MIIADYFAAKLRAAYAGKRPPLVQLSRSAMVFSPHFDDETLGCGGTIAKKKQAGADVKVVFMTDGSKSHNGLIPESKLAIIREREGLAACRRLGVASDDVFCLRFQETRLNISYDAAVAAVCGLIEAHNPAEIYVPYQGEPPMWSLDHLFTTRIVMAALQAVPGDRYVHEYPIWFWFHWPWIRLGMRDRRQARMVLRNTMRYRFGFRFLRNFDCSAYIGDVLDIKRRALQEHRSQMTRLLPDPRWRTLADVAEGQFLKCFYQPYEIFKRYRYPNVTHDHPIPAASRLAAMDAIEG